MRRRRQVAASVASYRGSWRRWLHQPGRCLDGDGCRHATWPGQGRRLARDLLVLHDGLGLVASTSLLFPSVACYSDLHAHLIAHSLTLQSHGTVAHDTIDDRIIDKAGCFSHSFVFRVGACLADITTPVICDKLQAVSHHSRARPSILTTVTGLSPPMLVVSSQQQRMI